ncbi:MAG: methyltransferase domain-containing protein [Oligella ureolytica]|nr:methyltransferase domain-containing protein [Oligella ureolytica]
MNRQDGYIIDTSYPLHFYKEMQPNWLGYIANTLGCVSPKLTKPYRYCELGCATGIGLLVAAACNPRGQFIGVDFNAEHIATADALARKAGIKNIEFILASFDDFAEQYTEPFDVIVTHGVWSWLAPKAQIGIMQIIHKLLKPQGLLYLQYMCYPAAARLISLQKVLHEVSIHNPDKSSEESVKEGLALLRHLANNGAGLFVDNPELEKELTLLEKENPAYLAHDFLTDYWRPQHSADVHRIFAQADVTYIGSANCYENMDTLSVPGNLQALIAQTQSRAMQETLRDVARHQNQRVDIFQKQPQTLNDEQYEKVIDRFVYKALPNLPKAGAIIFDTPIGKITGPKEIFTPLIEALASGDKSFAELRQLSMFSHAPGLLLQSLNMLMWADYIHPLRQDDEIATAHVELQAWIDELTLPLALVPECGTAVRK